MNISEDKSKQREKYLEILKADETRLVRFQCRVRDELIMKVSLWTVAPTLDKLVWCDVDVTPGHLSFKFRDRDTNDKIGACVCVSRKNGEYFITFGHSENNEAVDSLVTAFLAGEVAQLVYSAGSWMNHFMDKLESAKDKLEESARAYSEFVAIYQ